MRSSDLQTLNRIRLLPKSPLIGGKFIHPDEVTVLFGHGSAGKGLIASWVVRQLDAEGYCTMILDFERHEQEWVERLPRVSDLVYYRDPVEDIMRMQGKIERDIERFGVNALIVDSASRAAPDPNRGEGDAGVARRVIALLNSFGIPALLIAHVPKRRADEDGPSHVANPLGSVQWTNQARLTWSVIKLDGAEGFTVSEAKCMKVNDRAVPPMHTFTWDHSNQDVTVARGTFSKTWTLTSAIYNLLSDGKVRYPADIALALLEMYPSHVSAISRMQVERIIQNRKVGGQNRPYLFQKVVGGWTAVEGRYF